MLILENEISVVNSNLKFTLNVLVQVILRATVKSVASMHPNEGGFSMQVCDAM